MNAPRNAATPAAVAGPDRAAYEARDALASALARAGIPLPAVRVRSPWAGEPGCALVNLGVCTPPVARALAAVIVNGAER